MFLKDVEQVVVPELSQNVVGKIPSPLPKGEALKPAFGGREIAPLREREPNRRCLRLAAQWPAKLPMLCRRTVVEPTNRNALHIQFTKPLGF